MEILPRELIGKCMQVVRYVHRKMGIVILPACG